MNKLLSYLINGILEYSQLKYIKLDETVILITENDRIEVNDQIKINNIVYDDVENAIETYLFNLKKQITIPNYKEYDIEFIVATYETKYTGTDDFVPGCYRIIYSDNTQYVGQSMNLHRRILEHLNTSKDIMDIYLYKLPKINQNDLLYIETEMINYYRNQVILRNIQKVGR